MDEWMGVMYYRVCCEDRYEDKDGDRDRDKDV